MHDEPLKTSAGEARFALAGSFSHKQRVYHQKSINIQQSFHLGHCRTFYRKGLKYQQKFAKSWLQERESSTEIDDDLPSWLA